MRNRLHLLLATFLFLLAAGPGRAEAPVMPAPVITASSMQGADLAASRVMDGDTTTRWSSDFRDGEWLLVDFGTPIGIGGLRILWETAYGRDYDILLSDDGRSWTRVAAVRYGDGGTDEMFFGRRTARYLRLDGIRRGTGWGFSIWEMETLGHGAVPALTASSEAEPIARAMDGDTTTAWRSTGAGPQLITVEFREPKDLGGLEIHWGADFASHYSVSVSDDGKDWRTIADVPNGAGGEDLTYFDRVKTQWLRLNCLDGDGDAYAVREILLKGGDESWSPMRFYESLQSRLPAGALPRWIRREQTFWTITGVPKDAEESLIGEEGTIEPFTGSFSVTPFVTDGDRVVTHLDCAVAQTLEENSLPLPTVTWTAPDFTLQVSAVSFGEPGSSWTAARYTVANRSAKQLDLNLALAIRPLQLNPPWQHGGVSRIDSAAIGEDERTVHINGRLAVLAMTDPSDGWLVDRNGGDVFTSLAERKPPESRSLADDKGLISGALRFNAILEPKQSRSFVVLYPLHSGSVASIAKQETDESFFRKTWAEQGALWRERLSGWKIDAPEPRLADIARANLAYMLLTADYAAPQPGPRNYAKAWARDGALAAGTYLKLGQNQVVKDYLEWFTPQIDSEGFVPPMLESHSNRIPDWARDWKEYDAQGQYVYAVKHYLDFTRDAELVKRAWPTVKSVLKYQQALIDKRKSDKYRGTEYYGLLPESNSHEGYFPAMHSYWDDFFAARGFKDGIALAETLGDRPTAALYKNQEAEFHRDFYASLRRVIARDTLTYIPGCAEKGDFDPTSTSIALNACDEQAALLADPILSTRLDDGYDRYMKEVRPRWEGGTWASFTPYEIRNAEALVRLGRRRDANLLMEWFIGEPVRPRGWNHFAEVVHTDPRTGSYIGDMPHTWVASDYINALRSFFVYEDGDRLVIAAGVPEEWLGVGVEIELPTAFGRIAYSLKREKNSVILQLSGDAAPPGGFVFRQPLPRLKSAAINGIAVRPSADGSVWIKKAPARVILVPSL